MPNINLKKELREDKLMIMVKEGFDEVHRKLATVDQKIESLSKEMGRGFEEAYHRFDQVDSHAFGLDNRTERLEDTVKVLKTKFKMA